jgi:hypothetical protein
MHAPAYCLEDARSKRLLGFDPVETPIRVQQGFGCGWAATDNCAPTKPFKHLAKP